MATVQLDHIVILLPYAQILNPPSYLTDHFTVTPGGRHGDGKTQNNLIVFKDGSYLELIAFIDDKPEHREGHWWGDKGYGIIDYAFTIKEGPDAFQVLQTRASNLEIPENWRFQDLRGGSRSKPDGEKIEWRVSFPQAAARGRSPFWCFDVTPRERRVPKSEAITTHPSGAKGVGNLMIYLEKKSADMQALKSLLDALIPQDESERADDYEWDIGGVEKIESFVGCQICLMDAKQDAERQALQAGRQLVARLSILTEDNIGGGDIRRIKQKIEGDDLMIAFVGA